MTRLTQKLSKMLKDSFNSLLMTQSQQNPLLRGYRQSFSHLLRFFSQWLKPFRVKFLDWTCFKYLQVVINPCLKTLIKSFFQPYLIPFLKKSLPLLRRSMQNSTGSSPRTTNPQPGAVPPTRVRILNNFVRALNLSPIYPYHQDESKEQPFFIHWAIKWSVGGSPLSCHCHFSHSLWFIK